ncbi:hypothetical protein BD289DRAFT_279601 [Coniella lustricola]|uniref:Uncharacterized protein n=1 Tax=Coniella lustricola TaxID=2025994 RepID=A0A2T3A6D1_9PEZI|nr:hypothetical protein BD289DRAFT_279601 [Coniella lustricola]
MNVSEASTVSSLSGRPRCSACAALLCGARRNGNGNRPILHTSHRPKKEETVLGASRVLLLPGAPPCTSRHHPLGPSRARASLCLALSLTLAVASMGKEDHQPWPPFLSLFPLAPRAPESSYRGGAALMEHTTHRPPALANPLKPKAQHAFPFSWGGGGGFVSSQLNHTQTQQSTAQR